MFPIYYEPFYSPSKRLFDLEPVIREPRKGIQDSSGKGGMYRAAVDCFFLGMSQWLTIELVVRGTSGVGGGSRPLRQASL